MKKLIALIICAFPCVSGAQPNWPSYDDMAAWLLEIHIICITQTSEPVETCMDFGHQSMLDSLEVLLIQYENAAWQCQPSCQYMEDILYSIEIIEQTIEVVEELLDLI